MSNSTPICLLCGKTILSTDPKCQSDAREPAGCPLAPGTGVRVLLMKIEQRELIKAQEKVT